MSAIYDRFKEKLLGGDVEFVYDEDHINLMCSGTYQPISINPMILGSASSLDLDNPVYAIPEGNEPIMWKCEACDRVHKLEDTLECECGMPITEKSKFVLFE